MKRNYQSWSCIRKYEYVQDTYDFGGDLDWKVWYRDKLTCPNSDILKVRIKPHGFRAWFILRYHYAVTGVSWDWLIKGDELLVWFVLGGRAVDVFFCGHALRAAKHFTIWYAQDTDGEITTHPIAQA